MILTDARKTPLREAFAGDAMAIRDYLTPDRVKLNLQADTRFGAIKELANLIFRSATVTDKVDFLNSILLREELNSTAIFPLIALPHGVTSTVPDLVAALGTSERGIDFQSETGDPTRLVLLIATPPERHQDYLKLLSHFSCLFRQEGIVESMIRARDPASALAVLEEAEKGALLFRA